MKRLILPACLGLAIICSIVSLISARHQTRTLFFELHQLRAQQQQATDERGRLQLELATLGSLSAINHRARTELHMQIPDQIATLALPAQP
ncbi:MAG: cell division protein FtsL [Pseudomonadota bacterium]